MGKSHRQASNRNEGYESDSNPPQPPPPPPPQTMPQTIVVTAPQMQGNCPYCHIGNVQRQLNICMLVCLIIFAVSLIGLFFLCCLFENRCTYCNAVVSGPLPPPVGMGPPPPNAGGPPPPGPPPPPPPQMQPSNMRMQ